jgi:methionine--tRNA ligase beta chain
MISFNDFKEVELGIATVKEVNDHPDADKLYVLKVSLKDEQRQLVAGIKPYYAKEDLIGKQIVVVLNLEPAVIRGIESEGMLLAARDSENVVILTTERKVEDGSKVS